MASMEQGMQEGDSERMNKIMKPESAADKTRFAAGSCTQLPATAVESTGDGFDDAHEKRRSFRFPVSGRAALCTRFGVRSSYSLDNISLGGALLFGASAIKEGELLDAEVLVSGAPPVNVRARVRRRLDTGGHTGWLALEFAPLSADAEDRIHDVFVRLLEDKNQVVLVVGQNPLLSGELCRQLQALERRFVRVWTPLDALMAMQSGRFRVVMVVVEDELTQTCGIELLRFFAHDYRGVHRVLLTNRASGEAPADGVTAARVCAPWTITEVRELLVPISRDGASGMLLTGPRSRALPTARPLGEVPAEASQPRG